MLAYRPRIVVAYAGDNDLRLRVQLPRRRRVVLGDVQKFVQIVHSKLPESWIYVISKEIKPSGLCGGNRLA